MPVFHSGYCEPKVALFQRFHDWPMLDYISKTLFHYLSFITHFDETIKAMLLRFFKSHNEPRGGNFGAWVQAFSPHISVTNIESSTPLYYAARAGLVPLMKMILDVEGTKNLEVPGGTYGSTPLHVAAWAGRTEMVRELLQAGANAIETSEDGFSGLQWAVISKYRDNEFMLRDAGTKLDDDFNPGYGEVGSSDDGIAE